MNKRRQSESEESGSLKRAKFSLTNKVDLETGLSKCFHLVKTKLYLSLAPCHMNAPIEGLKSQHLNTLVMSYNRDLDGIIIGYRNVQLAEDYINTEEDTILAKVSNENPFTFLWVSVEFIVWSPKVGDVLEGNCVMQSRGHIGLLINDVFNATIRKKNIPSNWEFVPNQQDEGEQEGQKLGHWADENGLPVDGKLKFTVRSIHAAGKSISVEGTLLGKGEEADEQPVKLNFSLDDDTSATKSSHMKFDVDDENAAASITIDGVNVQDQGQEEEENDDDDEAALQYNDNDEHKEDEDSDSNANSDAESDSDSE